MQSLKYRVTRLAMAGVLSALVLPTAFAAKAATSFKAVDANGEPMVMYTGTSSDKDFTKFKMPKNGTWFHYCPVKTPTKSTG